MLNKTKQIFNLNSYRKTPEKFKLRGVSGIFFAMNFLLTRDISDRPVNGELPFNAYRFYTRDKRLVFDYGSNEKISALSNLRFITSRSLCNIATAGTKIHVRRLSQSFLSFYSQGSDVGTLSFRSVFGIARVMMRYNFKLTRSGSWWKPTFASVSGIRDIKDKKKTPLHYAVAPYVYTVTPLGRNARSIAARLTFRVMRYVGKFSRIRRAQKRNRPNFWCDKIATLHPIPFRMHKRFKRLETTLLKRVFTYRMVQFNRRKRSEHHRFFRRVSWRGIHKKYKGTRRFPRTWDKIFKYITLRSQKANWLLRHSGSSNWGLHSRKFAAFRSGSTFGGSVAYVAGVASGSATIRRNKRYYRPRPRIFIKPFSNEVILEQRGTRGRLYKTRWFRDAFNSPQKKASVRRNYARTHLLAKRASARLRALMATATHRALLQEQDPSEMDAYYSLYRLFAVSSWRTVDFLKTGQLQDFARPVKKNAKSAKDGRSVFDMVYGDNLGTLRGHILNRWFAFDKRKKPEHDLEMTTNATTVGQIQAHINFGKRYHIPPLPFTYRNRIVTAGETFLAKGIISQAQTGSTSRLLNDLFSSSVVKAHDLVGLLWEHAVLDGKKYTAETPRVGYLPIATTHTRSFIWKNKKFGCLNTRQFMYENNEPSLLTSVGAGFTPRYSLFGRRTQLFSSGFVGSPSSVYLGPILSSSRTWTKNSLNIPNSHKFSELSVLYGTGLGSHVFQRQVNGVEYLGYRSLPKKTNLFKETGQSETPVIAKYLGIIYSLVPEKAQLGIFRNYWKRTGGGKKMLFKRLKSRCKTKRARKSRWLKRLKFRLWSILFNRKFTKLIGISYRRSALVSEVPRHDLTYGFKLTLNTFRPAMSNSYWNTKNLTTTPNILKALGIASRTALRTEENTKNLLVQSCIFRTFIFKNKELLSKRTITKISKIVKKITIPFYLKTRNFHITLNLVLKKRSLIDRGLFGLCKIQETSKSFLGLSRKIRTLSDLKSRTYLRVLAKLTDALESKRSSSVTRASLVSFVTNTKVVPIKYVSLWQKQRLRQIFVEVKKRNVSYTLSSICIFRRRNPHNGKKLPARIGFKRSRFTTEQRIVRAKKAAALSRQQATKEKLRQILEERRRYKSRREHLRRKMPTGPYDTPRLDRTGLPTLADTRNARIAAEKLAKEKAAKKARHIQSWDSIKEHFNKN